MGDVDQGDVDDDHNDDSKKGEEKEESISLQKGNDEHRGFLSRLSSKFTFSEKNVPTDTDGSPVTKEEKEENDVAVTEECKEKSKELEKTLDGFDSPSKAEN